MKKFCDKVLISLSLLTALFPFVLAVFCALPNLFGGWVFLWTEHDYAFYGMPNVSGHLGGGLLIFFVVACGFVVGCHMFNHVSAKRAPLAVFLFVLVTRGVLALLAGDMSAPYSDFGASWERACSGVLTSNCNHILYPAWVRFSHIQRFFVAVVGGFYPLWLFFGAVCNAFTALLIYLISRVVFERNDVAIVGALLYAVYPSGLAYVVTATPEHIAIVSFALVVWFFVRYGNRFDFSVRIILVAALVGVLAGVGNAVKPVFPLFATAIVMALVLLVVRAENKRAMMQCVCVALLIVCSIEVLTLKAVSFGSDRAYASNIRGRDPTPHYLAVGLNRQGEGQLHLGGLSRMWSSLVLKGVSDQEATKLTLAAVKDDWCGRLNEVGPFFAKKMVWAWQDDNVPFQYAMLQLGAKTMQKLSVDTTTMQIPSSSGVSSDAPTTVKWLDEARQYVQAAAFIWYFAVMLMGGVGIVWYVRRHAVGWRYGLISLLPLGYFGMTVLCEAQSRYKCLIMPYVFILVAPFVARLVMPRSDAAK